MKYIIQSTFCNKSSDELEERISELIADNFLGQQLLMDIRQRYDDMRSNFNFDYKQWHEFFKNEKWKPYKFPENDDTTYATVPIYHSDFMDLKGKCSIGFDLPTWFNVKEKKTIMIISQDPLRSAYYRDCQDVVLSTPYALHDAEHRIKSWRQYVYFNIFDSILEKGLGLYLTDARKFYIKKEANKYSKTKRDIYRDCLKKEIAIVKPSLIVAFGSDASRYLVPGCNFYEVTSFNDTAFLPMIHPSMRCRYYIKQRFGISSNDDVAKKYVEMIIDSLVE